MSFCLRSRVLYNTLKLRPVVLISPALPNIYIRKLAYTLGCSIPRHAITCFYPQQTINIGCSSLKQLSPLRLASRLFSQSFNNKNDEWDVKSTGRSPGQGHVRKETRIDQQRAAAEYCLSPDELIGVPFQIKHRSPFSGVKQQMITYLKSDVETRAREKWGSIQNMEREKIKRSQARKSVEPMWKRIASAYRMLFGWRRTETKTLFFQQDPNSIENHQHMQQLKESMIVVFYAIISNCIVTAGKFSAFFYTGSASMLSEGIHSMADVANQSLLAIGAMRSLKQADGTHPYGYLNERYLWALISGVGIFFVGSGVSCYHGVMCLLHPAPIENISIAFTLLAMSGFLEGSSLLVAARQVKENARRSGVSIRQYIKEGSDPNDVAVLIEDSAAVLGVGIAGACLALTHVYSNPVFDALGSISIGTLLGGCAVFLIHRNMDALLGRSISPARIKLIMARLDQDPVISSTHDVKATQIGANTVRFKAEIDVDGQAIAERYVEKVTCGLILDEMRQVTNEQQMQVFMGRHGSGIINVLGEEVDRIECEIKEVMPEVRHVDLEIV